MCDDCRNELHAANNKKQGLPKLKGSPKQISWAESIRSEKMKDLDEIIAKMDMDTKGTVEQRAKIDNAIDSIKNQSNAFWWINNQYQTVINLIRANAN